MKQFPLFFIKALVVISGVWMLFTIILDKDTNNETDVLSKDAKSAAVPERRRERQSPDFEDQRVDDLEPIGVGQEPLSGEEELEARFTYGVTAPVKVEGNAVAQSVAEALSSDAYPERLMPLVVKAFDAEAYQRDPGALPRYNRAWACVSTGPTGRGGFLVLSG